MLSVSNVNIHYRGVSVFDDYVPGERVRRKDITPEAIAGIDVDIDRERVRARVANDTPDAAK